MKSGERVEESDGEKVREKGGTGGEVIALALDRRFDRMIFRVLVYS